MEECHFSHMHAIGQYVHKIYTVNYLNALQPCFLGTQNECRMAYIYLNSLYLYAQVELF